METVYISAGISAGMLYGFICGEQMLKYIKRDGCSINTIINCVGTPFVPVIVPLVLGGECLCKCMERRFYDRADEENQNNQATFEGFQERTNNNVTN